MAKPTIKELLKAGNDLSIASDSVEDAQVYYNMKKDAYDFIRQNFISSYGEGTHHDRQKKPFKIEIKIRKNTSVSWKSIAETFKTKITEDLNHTIKLLLKKGNEEITKARAAKRFEKIVNEIEPNFEEAKEAYTKTTEKEITKLLFENEEY